jgi:hypothetical protein
LQYPQSPRHGVLDSSLSRRSCGFETKQFVHLARIADRIYRIAEGRVVLNEKPLPVKFTAD